MKTLLSTLLRADGAGCFLALLLMNAAAAAFLAVSAGMTAYDKEDRFDDCY